MKNQRFFGVSLLLALILGGCNLPVADTTISSQESEMTEISPTHESNPLSENTLASQPAEENASQRRCGDGTCDGPEGPDNCPEDCLGQAGSGQQPLETQAGEEHRVTNPASGVELFVNVYRPADTVSGSLPALVLVPGGIADSRAFSMQPFTAPYLAGRGYVVVIFDADGRGRSTGEENYNGFIQQDGLAEVIRFTAGLPEVDPGKIGLVSFSYGVTMASGAMARYPDLPVLFYIDWEGPVDRYYTTTNCQASGHIDWADCNDDAFWSEREAVAFIQSVEVPYQRLQSEEDHVQPNNNHAIDIINAANAGVCPWTRLNNLEPNQDYDTAYPPAMIPENKDGQLRVSIGNFADELLEMFSAP